MASIPLPKFLKDLIDGFTLADVINWLEEQLLFYIRPRRVFISFFKKDRLTKIRQLIFYLIIYSTVLLLSNSISFNESYLSVVKLLIIALFFTLPIVLIAKLLGYRQSFKKILLYEVIVCIFWTYPSLIFISAFIQTGSYVVLFFYSFFNAILLFYIYFFCWHILFNKPIKIICGYILTIAFLNIYILILVLALNKMDGQPNGTSPDIVLQEFYSTVGELNDFGIPSTKAIIHSKGSPSKVLFGFSHNDTVSYNTNADSAWFVQISETNIKILDSALKKVTFKKNRELLSQLKLHYSSMIELLRNSPCDTCLFRIAVRTNSNNDTIEMRYEFDVDSSYLYPLVKLNNDIEKQEDKSYYALMPNSIFATIFLPANLILDTYNIDKLYDLKIQ